MTPGHYPFLTGIHIIKIKEPNFMNPKEKESEKNEDIKN